MIKRIINLFSKKKEIIGWEEYKKKVDFLDMFYWQQSVRRENVKRSKMISRDC